MVTGLALYAQHRVVRYARITVDPAPRPVALVLANGLEVEARGGYLKSSKMTRFRAYQPDVYLRIRSDEPIEKHIIQDLSRLRIIIAQGGIPIHEVSLVDNKNPLVRNVVSGSFKIP